MKTFQQYLNLKELASYDQEPAKQNNDEMDNSSSSALEAVRRGIKKMIEIKPQDVVAFLNTHRMEPEIKEILTDYKLDSFQNIGRKHHGGMNEKGLGNEDGTKPKDDEEMHPNAADGYTAH